MATKRKRSSLGEIKRDPAKVNAARGGQRKLSLPTTVHRSSHRPGQYDAFVCVPSRASLPALHRRAKRKGMPQVCGFATAKTPTRAIKAALAHLSRKL